MKQRRITKNRSIKSGYKPGTLIHIGNHINNNIKIESIRFNKNLFEQVEIKSIPEKIDNNLVTWINIDGLNDIELFKKIGTNFSIHPLVLEDILNTNQRPKVDEYKEYIHITMKIAIYNEESKKTNLEQLSLILGKNYLISFQEKKSHIFQPIIKRLKNSKGSFRSLGADYLCYAIIDTIVDNYFSTLESIEDKIEIFEDRVINNASRETLKEIYELKREMIIFRKAVWPLREVVNSLQRGDLSLINESTLVYFKDVYDHVYEIIDTSQLFIDIITGMLDTYLSSVSNKMNEVMKFLTIFSTIFIPVTFLAGVYGMNFKNIPELSWQYSYPMFWIIVIGISVIMIRYFKRKKWM
ncbi:MAG: corA [Clostridiaceae bacterium]|jgi:magnesium transporter|nr:corA [Clostridiaceae bacterium]